MRRLPRRFSILPGSPSRSLTQAHLHLHPPFYFHFPLLLYFSLVSAWMCRIGSIANDLPSLPLSLSSSLPLVHSAEPSSGADWSGQGLQHRTWVLSVPAARVLCCSQWSCLSSSRPVFLLWDWAVWTVDTDPGIQGWKCSGVDDSSACVCFTPPQKMYLCPPVALESCHLKTKPAALGGVLGTWARGWAGSVLLTSST